MNYALVAFFSALLAAPMVSATAQMKSKSQGQGAAAPVAGTTAPPNLSGAAQASLEITPPITLPPNNGGNPVTLPSPSGGSGSGAVTYSSSTPNICEVSGSTLTPISPGSCVITATKEASGVYGQASATATLSIVDVQQASLELNLSGIDLRNGPVILPAASGGSGLIEITYSVTGQCTLEPATRQLTASGIGSCEVTATNPANGLFRVATVTRTISIVSRQQNPLVVTLPTSWANNVGTASVSGGSGSGSISWSSSNTAVCTVSGSGNSAQVTRVGLGSCSLSASKGSDTELFYSEATGSTPLTVLASDFISRCWVAGLNATSCGGSGRPATKNFIDSTTCASVAFSSGSYGLYLDGANGSYVKNAASAPPSGYTISSFITRVDVSWNSSISRGSSWPSLSSTERVVCVE